MSATHLCSPQKPINRKLREGGESRGCFKVVNGLQPELLFLSGNREGKPENLCPSWTGPKMDLTTFEPKSGASGRGQFRTNSYIDLEMGVRDFRDPLIFIIAYIY